MEITVNIPLNDYVQPSEVRQEVVQYICEAFLSNSHWNCFHPYKDPTSTRYRNATLYVKISKREKITGWGFDSYDKDDKDSMIKFNGCEMQAAFKALREAGYHIFRVYTYGTWKGYVCKRKPYSEGTEVTTFNDFID